MKEWLFIKYKSFIDKHFLWIALVLFIFFLMIVTINFVNFEKKCFFQLILNGLSLINPDTNSENLKITIFLYLTFFILFFILNFICYLNKLKLKFKILFVILLLLVLMSNSAIHNFFALSGGGLSLIISFLFAFFYSYLFYFLFKMNGGVIRKIYFFILLLIFGIGVFYYLITLNPYFYLIFFKINLSHFIGILIGLFYFFYFNICLRVKSKNIY